MQNTNLNYPDFKRYNTFPKILKFRSDTMPNDVALRDKDLGIWNETSWKEYNQKVSELAKKVYAYMCMYRSADYCTTSG